MLGTLNGHRVCAPRAAGWPVARRAPRPVVKARSAIKTLSTTTQLRSYLATTQLASPALDARFKDKPNFVFTGTAAEPATTTATNNNVPEYGGNLVPPCITKPDEAFHAQGLEFVVGGDQVSIPELNYLFQMVGFPQRDPVKLKIALDNTYIIMWVRTTTNTAWAKKGSMVGFARAASDGFLSATIWDVSVHPAFQRLGIGRGLMERLTHQLVVDGIPTITLYAEPKVIELYEKVGFTKDPEGIRGMAFQRRKRDSLQHLAAVRNN